MICGVCVYIVKVVGLRFRLWGKHENNYTVNEKSLYAPEIVSVILIYAGKVLGTAVNKSMTKSLFETEKYEGTVDAE